MTQHNKSITNRNGYRITSTYTKRAQHYNSTIHTHSIALWYRTEWHINSNINTCEITILLIITILCNYLLVNIRHSTNNSLSIKRRILLISGHISVKKQFTIHLGVELDNLGRNWFSISGYGMITISHSNNAFISWLGNNYFVKRTFTPEMKAQYAQQQ